MSTLWYQPRKGHFILTQLSAEGDEVEDVVPGEPGSGLDVAAARKFPVRNGKIRRLLTGLALRDPVQQLHRLLADCVGVLKINEIFIFMSKENNERGDERKGNGE